MDTPGFDTANEQMAYREIFRGIQAVRPVARIAGLLYITCINQPRFDDIDRKLVRFIGDLCGPDYIPRVTFVTTFWTTASPKQQAVFDKQLELLQHEWTKGLGCQQLSRYQHGLVYDDDGQETKSIIDWFADRIQTAQHAKAMISRRYGRAASGQSALTPRIVQELDRDTAIHETLAGRLLGMHLTSPVFKPQPSLGKQPDGESTQRKSTSGCDGDSRIGPEGRQDAADTSTRGNSGQEPETPTSTGLTWGQIAKTAAEWVVSQLKNVDFGVETSGSMPGQSFTMGGSNNGPMPHSAYVMGDRYKGKLGLYSRALQETL